MKTRALALVIFPLFVSGCNEYADTVPQATAVELPPPPVGTPLGVEILDESDFKPIYAPADPFEADYNTASQSTARGPVLGLRRAELGEGQTFLIAEVGLSGDVVDVILGPENYLKRHGVSVEVADDIHVIGSRTVRNTRDTIIARRLHANRKTIDLRDDSGRGLWY